MSAQTERDLAAIDSAWTELEHALTCNGLLIAALRECRRIRDELAEVETFLIARAGPFADNA